LAAPTIPGLPSGIAFEGLYDREGLLKLDRLFLAELAQHDTALHEQLLRARENPAALASKQESELLLALAPHLDRYVARLFGIEAEIKALSARHLDLAPLYGVKRQFVQRKAMHGIKREEAEAFDGPALARGLERAFNEPFTELTFARHVA